jgi:hypothetical protein
MIDWIFKEFDLKIKTFFLFLLKEEGNIEDLLYVIDKATGKFDLIEMKIRESKLKEAKRYKEDLESKLLNL